MGRVVSPSRVIIIMQMCKAPTLLLKALNKYTHIVYIEMDVVVVASVATLRCAPWSLRCVLRFTNFIFLQTLQLYSYAHVERRKTHRRIASYQTTATRNGSAIVPKISFLATDSDLTVIDLEFPSSNVLDNPPAEMASGSDRGRSIKEDLKAALCHPDALELVSEAVASQLPSQLRKEIAGLRDKVAEKDREILFLKDQIDSLEPYSRRNCLRKSTPWSRTIEGTVYASVRCWNFPRRAQTTLSRQSPKALVSLSQTTPSTEATAWEK